jgi:hypothetical protein
MAVPENFSEWEHLQSTLIIYHNKLVREEFSDIEADDALEIPRGSLKRACLLKDDDTVDMTVLRLYLLFFHARKAADLQAPLFGIPVGDYDERKKYKPQVTLYFSQDDDSVPQKRRPTNAEIAFRLVNETAQTITEGDLNSIALRIKTEFGASNGYRWRKGRVLCTYIDREHGLHLYIYAFNESEGREVINKVCDVAVKPFNDDYLSIHESRRSWPTNPGTQMILGRARPKPVERPVVYVRFRKATLSIHGLPLPIQLVARRYGSGNPKQVF